MKAQNEQTKPRRMKDITPTSGWRQLTPGGMILAAGNSADFKTGDWRTETPRLLTDKCTHCLLCVPLCPDSSIPVAQGRRLDFDYFHCKGCGICAKVCPVGAITFAGEE